MKIVIYGVFCFCLVVGSGCALTEYELITDNDQVGRSGAAEKIINTNGKAKINTWIKVASTYSDGRDEIFWMTDQRADGTATITTYNNFSTGGGAIFHDDLYCNPDWNGCAIFTAPDDNDGRLFDGKSNWNCSGARSISLLFTTTRYYGECGRFGMGSKMDLASKMQLLNTFELGKVGSREALYKKLSSQNTNLYVVKDGLRINVPVVGGYEIGILPNRSISIDATNSLNRRNYDTAAAFVDRYGPGKYAMTIEVEGVSATWQVSPLSAATIRAQGLRRY